MGMWTTPVLFAAMMLTGSPAQAEDQDPVLRCLAATSAVAANPDKSIAQIGIMNSLYWLGRLDPALPEAEIEKRLSEIAPKLNGQILQAELRRCGMELAIKGAMMQRIGKAMQERAVRSDTH